MDDTWTEIMRVKTLIVLFIRVSGNFGNLIFHCFNAVLRNEDIIMLFQT